MLLLHNVGTTHVCADICAIGNGCLNIHNHERPVYACFKWEMVFPMKAMIEANRALLNLFTIHPIPSVCICDNPKEMISCQFGQKFNGASCHLLLSVMWYH